MLITALHGKKKSPTIPSQQQRRSRKRRKIKDLTAPANNLSILEHSYTRGISFPLISCFRSEENGPHEEIVLTGKEYDFRP